MLLTDDSKTKTVNSTLQEQKNITISKKAYYKDFLKDFGTRK